MVGVSQGVIAMLEKRQRTQPHPQTVHKLAQALGITPDDPWSDEKQPFAPIHRDI